MYLFFSYIFLLYFIYSVLGYVIEVLHLLYDKKKFIYSRGFLLGPYIPIFGIGALLITSILSKYSNDLFTVFIMSIALCGILEYLTSYFMEKIFGLRWWDYSTHKYNLNGRISLSVLIGFGLAGVILVSFINPFVYSYIHSIDPLIIMIIASILAILFLIDFAICTYATFLLKEKIESNVITDNTSEIKDCLKKLLTESNILYKHILRAFPNIISININKLAKLNRLRLPKIKKTSK